MNAAPGQIADSLTRLSQEVGSELARHVAEMYCDQAPALLDSIRQAVAEEDRSSLVRHAHDLSSTSALVGAAELAQTAADTELSLEQGADLAVVPLDRLDGLGQEAVAALQLLLGGAD